MKTKILLTCSFLILIFNVIYCQSLDTFENKELSKIKSLEFKYVDYYIETPIDISCKNFDNSFLDYRYRSITDSNKIRHLFAEIKRILKRNKQSKLKADVRIKFMVKYFNGNYNTYCIGVNRIDIGNNSYFIDEKFRKSIFKLVYKK